MVDDGQNRGSGTASQALPFRMAGGISSQQASQQRAQQGAGAAGAGCLVSWRPVQEPHTQALVNDSPPLIRLILRIALERSYIAGHPTVAIAVLRSRNAALISDRRRAGAVIDGVDCRAARNQGMRPCGTTILRKICVEDGVERLGSVAVGGCNNVGRSRREVSYASSSLGLQIRKFLRGVLIAIFPSDVIRWLRVYQLLHVFP